MISDNLELFLVAYILGITSPNSKRKNVMTTTSIMIFVVELTTPSGKSALDKYEARIIIDTLIKLFAINIIANSSLGFSSKLSTVFEDLFFLFSIQSISTGLNEKKATSAPDTKAERTSKKNRTIPVEIKGISSIFQLICPNKSEEKRFSNS